MESYVITSTDRRSRLEDGFFVHSLWRVPFGHGGGRAPFRVKTIFSRPRRPACRPATSLFRSGFHAKNKPAHESWFFFFFFNSVRRLAPFFRHSPPPTTRFRSSRTCRYDLREDVFVFLPENSLSFFRSYHSSPSFFSCLNIRRPRPYNITAVWDNNNYQSGHYYRPGPTARARELILLVRASYRFTEGFIYMVGLLLFRRLLENRTFYSAFQTYYTFSHLILSLCGTHAYIIRCVQNTRSFFFFLVQTNLMHTGRQQ